MNSLLAKYRPKDASAESFVEEWERLGVSLEPLAMLLQEYIASRRAAKEEDFENPMKVSFRAGETAMAQKILDILPSSSKM